VQVVTLPWLTRSALLTRPETEGLAIAEISELLLDRLRVALEGEIRQLDPEVPTILLGHLMTDTARFGAERFLAVGKGFTVPMALLTRACFDYVALGHVHRHQVLSLQPPVVYPGSIERVDFSEEHEDKGYILVNLEKAATTFEFCSLPVRRFCTIKVDVTEANDPMPCLLQAIAAEPIEDVVVRLLYQIRPDQLPQIETPVLQQALAAAHVYTIHPELVSQLARPRVPELGVGNAVEPLDALRSYLANHPHLKDLAHDMLEAAQTLVTGSADWVEMPDMDWATTMPLEGTPSLDDASTVEPAASQLRLL
jgi:DNA repair protein SbcD/Mre11